jgi:hypothetical protein
MLSWLSFFCHTLINFCTNFYIPNVFLAKCWSRLWCISIYRNFVVPPSESLSWRRLWALSIEFATTPIRVFKFSIQCSADCMTHMNRGVVFWLILLSARLANGIPHRTRFRCVPTREGLAVSFFLPDSSGSRAWLPNNLSFQIRLVGYKYCSLALGCSTFTSLPFILPFRGMNMPTAATT